MAIAGGLSYIEIATLIPSSGGDYAYLRDMYSTRLVEEERDDGRLTVTTVVVGGKGEEPLGGKE